MIDQSTVISHTIASACDAAVSQFADIRGKSIDGTCTLERVKLNQAQSLLQECTQKALQEDTAVQSAKQSLTQSAIATAEGLSLMGGAALLVLILLLVFVGVGAKAMKARAGGKGGAAGVGSADKVNPQKSLIWLCAIVCVVSLIAGGIMAGVGDPSKVTVYGYALQNKMDSCAARIDTKPGVESIEEAGNTVKTMHDSKSVPSVDAFFYDASTKELTTYGKPSSVPCSGITETRVTDKSEIDPEKKWAGFVKKESYITNIGFGLLGTSALFFILIFVSIFVFKQKRGSGSGVETGGSLPKLPFVSEVAMAPSRVRAGPPQLPGLQTLV